jgi:hypothetical protein
MIGKSGLLSILQFVAVLIPAFVVLIEIVISRDTGERIEVGSFRVDEIRLLEYSLVFLIVGTGLVLYRLLSFIENPFTTYGVIFVFGSIPLSVISLWIMSNRREYDESDDQDISAFFQKNVESTFYKVVVLFASVVAPIVALWASSRVVNNMLSFGIFYNGSILSPHQFVSIGFVICAVRSMSTVSDSYENSEVGFSRLLGGSLGSGIVIVIVYLLFSGIPYMIAILILRFANNYPFMDPTNVFLNIPFVWSVLVYYALLDFDYSPNIESDEETHESK